ncbi:competence type IV pilus assembly protein ComGB [Bacillus sp. DJP31]|uniref:competence type IV pilus assembly protein ComGB n=1 Tax=Bacillus sp. DJP31 TaxID=3409789 RepID=UPI003BB62F26
MRTNRSSWSHQEQAKLLKRLSILLDRGYPLLEALSFLMLHLPKRKQTLLQDRVNEMREGGTFHDALVKLSFNRDVLGYLYFAEQHGDLSFALREASLLVESKLNYMNRFFKIIQYPLFLAGITIALVLLINVFLLPEFSGVFESMDSNSSFIISTMLFFSKWFPRLFFFFLIAVIVFLIYFLFKFKQIPITQRVEWLSRLPIYGLITIKFCSQYFAMQLSQLLRGGLSVYEALSVFENQEHILLLQVEATQMKKELRSGESLSSIIESRFYFEEELSKTIAFGSANGELSRELYYYSKLSSEALEDHINRRLAIIQPTVFITIGIIIMGIYLAIMQPIFQILNEI